MRKSGGGGGGKSGGRGGGGKSGGGGGGGRSAGPHGSAGKSVGSHASTGKPGGFHSSVGKSNSSAMQCKPAAGNSGSGNLSRSQVGYFSAGPHGSAGKSVGSHASAGKLGGSHSSVGKSSSSAMQCKPAAGNSGSGNLSRSQVGHFSADPKSLHFTQESIKGSFRKGPMSGVKLHDAVAELKAGSSRPASSGLQVHRGQNGELWCENNRSLYVARQAGVPSVNVKVNSNDFKSRRLGGTTKDKLRDPNFLPTIRGARPPVFDGLELY